MPSTPAPRTPPTPMFCYCCEMLSLPVTVGSLWSLTGQVSPVGLSLQFGGSPDLSCQPAGARLADQTQRPYCYKLATWTMALWNKTYKDSIFPTVLEMQLKLCQTWEFKRSQVYSILIARHVIQLSTQVSSMVKGLMRQFVLTFGLCCFGAGLSLLFLRVSVSGCRCPAIWLCSVGWSICLCIENGWIFFII